MKAPFTLDCHAKKGLAEQMSDQIRAAIVAGRYRPGTRLPTIAEWAEALNVSAFVPRRALGQLAREGAVVIKRHVGAVVTERLARQKRWRVAYVSVDAGENWSRNVFSYEFGECFRKAGISYGRVHIPCRRGQFDLEPLKDALAEGIDFVVCELSDPRPTEPLRTAGIPFAVLAGGAAEFPGAQAVFRNDYDEVAQAIIRRARATNCRSILHVGFGKWKRDALTSPLYSAGLQVRRCHIPSPKDRSPPEEWQRKALHHFERLLRKGTDWLPDLILFSDDFLASGALLALTHHGVRIPEDVRVVTLSNSGLGPVYLKPLTRFEADVRREASEIAAYVEARLSDRLPKMPCLSLHLRLGETF